MAESSDKQLAKKRQLKKTETVRERSERAGSEQPRSRRIKTTANTASRPFKAAHRIGQKEYYLPLPDNKVGNFLNKRRRATPSFFVNAWKELRQVEWPSARETIRLTIAVFIFSILFGAIVAVTDYGLDKVFKKLFVS